MMHSYFIPVVYIDLGWRGQFIVWRNEPKEWQARHALIWLVRALFN